MKRREMLSMQAGVEQGWFDAMSLVQFDVAERRLVLPDTALEFAWVEGRIDVIGPMSVARRSRYAIGMRVVLLSVDPVIATAWLGVPLSALTDRVVALHEIDPERARQFEGKFEAGTVDDLVAGNALPTSRAGVAAAALARGVSVTDAAAAVNLCPRQLTRSFHDITGLHPKRFQRIARLRRAVLAAKTGTPLVEAAIDGGYADQAHFTREVKSLTGAAPRAILADVGNIQDMPPQIV